MLEENIYTSEHAKDAYKKLSNEVLLQIKALENDPRQKYIHIENNKVFPVYENDTLETILNRYVYTFPEEAKAMISEMKEEKDNAIAENGMSELRTIRKVTSIPAIIYTACMRFDQNFWKDKNNIMRFKILCPKLSYKGGI
jgi:hypothetical protein